MRVYGVGSEARVALRLALGAFRAEAENVAPLTVELVADCASVAGVTCEPCDSRHRVR